MKDITVSMTLEWSFNKKEWSDEQKHRESLLNNPSIVLGYDTLNSVFMLNDIVIPKATNIKVKNAN